MNGDDLTTDDLTTEVTDAVNTYLAGLDVRTAQERRGLGPRGNPGRADAWPTVPALLGCVTVR